MSEGYIYCLGNKCMPGIYKIGMTERTPEERLSEANKSDTFRPPTPYTIEFAKSVLNPRNKEYTIHTILKNTRINSEREFFNESLERIKLLFDLVDGEYWQSSRPDVSSNISVYFPTRQPELPSRPSSQPQRQPCLSLLVTNSENINDSQNKIEYISDNSESGEIYRNINGCRDMSLCFNHNQRIRHRIRKNKPDESIWISVYDANQGGILFEGNVLTLNQFASRHYMSEVPNRTSRVNAWLECECEINGSWISTYELPAIRH
jgi:hypothetical protein